LKHTLELLPLLSNVLRDSDISILKTCHDLIEDPSRQSVLDIILEYITVDSKVGSRANSQHISSSLVFAMKTGINGLLDVARVTYCETLEEINQVKTS
jgi:hypothetical protein